METRTVEQIRVYKLFLNRMVNRFESTELVAIAYSEKTLMDFYNGEKVEYYKDDNWSKQFKKGGPLEWYNALEWSEYVGVEREWSTMEDIQGFLGRPFNNTILVG